MFVVVVEMLPCKDEQKKKYPKNRVPNNAQKKRMREEEEKEKNIIQSEIFCFETQTGGFFRLLL